jgi:hypothetical protein
MQKNSRFELKYKDCQKRWRFKISASHFFSAFIVAALHLSVAPMPTGVS